MGSKHKVGILHFVLKISHKLVLLKLLMPFPVPIMRKGAGMFKRPLFLLVAVPKHNVSTILAKDIWRDCIAEAQDRTCKIAISLYPYVTPRGVFNTKATETWNLDYGNKSVVNATTTDG